LIGVFCHCEGFLTLFGLIFRRIYIQERIQDFKLGGAHLEKLRRTEGGTKNFGVFRVKKHDFTPKNHILSNCLTYLKVEPLYFLLFDLDLYVDSFLFRNPGADPGGGGGTHPARAPLKLEII
jgi:hypothetical protein